MQVFPCLDELLLNPVVAAAAVVAIVNVIAYAAGVRPNWLAVVVSLVYMAIGRRAPDQLFVAVVYAFLIVAPLARVDGAVLSRLFGAPAGGVRSGGRSSPGFFRPWL
jgi:ABC-type amino acid transport system permease subunit